MVWFSEWLARVSFGSSLRQRTWKKLAAQTRHGMGLEQSLRQMHKRAIARRLPTAYVYARVLEYLGFGHNLGESLSEFATPEEVMLISSGQRSGHLSEGLELAASLLAARQQLVQAVILALAHPLLLLGVCIALLLIVSIVVMPQFAMISDPTKWVGAAATFYTMTSFVASSFGLVTLLSVLGLVVISIVTLPIWTGKIRLIVESIPPWSIYRLTVGSVWLFTFSTLMRSGIQVSHILESMVNAENITPYLRERVIAVSIENARGKNLGESMDDSGMNFPDREVIDDLLVYATLPGFHNHIHTLASDWMQDGVNKVQRQSRLLKNVLLLFIIAIVAIMAMSVGSLQSQLAATSGGI